MASPSIVIKVKFGETLRRFNASVSDNKLALDIFMLREKIRGLFGFGPDVEFTMTYVDEDGDVVTLADDDDLHDVVSQSLNPVRITVNLNGSNDFNGSSGYSTPLRSPNQLPFQTLNSGVSELLKSVPEPLREALGKLPLDLASKASSSAPAVAELVEKMKDLYLNQLASQKVNPSTAAGPSGVKSEPSPKVQVKSEPSPKVQVKSEPSPKVQVKSEPSPKVQVKAEPSTNVQVKAEPLPKVQVKAEPPSVETKVQVQSEAGSSKSKKKGKQVVKAAEGVKFIDVKPPRGVDLNVPYFEHEPFQAPVSSAKSVGEGSTGIGKNTTVGVVIKEEFGSEKKDGNSSGSLNEPLRPDFSHYIEQIHKISQRVQDRMVARGSGGDKVAADVNTNVNNSGSSSGWPQGMLNAAWPFTGMPLANDSVSPGHGSSSGWPQGMMNAASPFTGMPLANDSVSPGHGSSSGWPQGMTNAASPFTGMPLANDSVSPGHHRHPRGPHWKRHGLVNNGIGTVFHMGVCCDGCGVHPITGPRFKSKVKENYDLCNACFVGLGNATDYIRIDRPATSFRRQHMPFNGFYDPSFYVPPPTLPHAMRAPGSKLHRSKLDSRFILDVNVLDGTIMAPFTAFTKIWRMRNNGTGIWPHGSQLQWIGGDRLSNSDFVDVEIPVDGLPVDKELDIAVDFTAPELPGRYVSYWKMASPSGQKFGQRVWVLIQVDASMKDLGETSINLNLPPVTRNPEVVNHDLVMDNILSGNNIIKVTDSGNTSAGFPSMDAEMNFPINDSLIIDNGGVSSTMATLSAPPTAASSSVYNSTQVANALASLPAGPAFSSSGLYPTVGMDTMVDFSVTPPAVVSGAPSSPPTAAVVKPSGSASREVSEQQEQALIKELEVMGFKQLDLNTEVLRMNNYDIEKSIDDLCGVLEWDPMLDELQEMGFTDEEANRRLLKKNNGSIKRVVMDLINGESA